MISPQMIEMRQHGYLCRPFITSSMSTDSTAQTSHSSVCSITNNGSDWAVVTYFPKLLSLPERSIVVKCRIFMHTVVSVCNTPKGILYFALTAMVICKKSWLVNGSEVWATCSRTPVTRRITLTANTLTSTLHACNLYSKWICCIIIIKT